MTDSAAYSAADIRAAEAPLLAAGEPLMARAAAAVAAVARELAPDGRVLVLAGTGDNGGDALFAAAELAAVGRPVDLFATAQIAHALAWNDAVRAGAASVTLEEIDADAYALVIDGILGIGASANPALRDGARAVVAKLRPSGPRVLAVDLPSGLHPDEGSCDGMVLRAAVTVTFGALKAGLVRGDGPEYAGQVRLVDLGLDMTGAAPAAGTTRAVEIERSYDVDADTPLPDWTALTVVVTVAAGELRDLDARYFDTDDLQLARAGFALRRRTGGPDAGWHLKGPLIDGARVELGWPLGDDATPPDAALAETGRVTADPLMPIARIRNARMAYALNGPDGQVAEFVDDRVIATDLRDGTVREWREWEVELGPTVPADREGFFIDVERLVRAAGGVPAASASKLARALGH